MMQPYEAISKVALYNQNFEFTENNHDSMCMKGPASDDEAPEIHDEFDSEITENSVIPNRCTIPNTVYMNRTGQCVPLCHSNHGYTKVIYKITICQSCPSNKKVVPRLFIRSYEICLMTAGLLKYSTD